MKRCLGNELTGGPIMAAAVVADPPPTHYIQVK
jgi:hypothetical protein